MQNYCQFDYEDCVFVFHKSGNQFGKSREISMVVHTGILGNEKFINDFRK